MSSENHKQDIKFLFTLRGEFLDAASKPNYSLHYDHAPVLNLAYAETIGHAIDLIGHGLERDAVEPLKKIETVFNQLAKEERKEANSLFSKILGGGVFNERATVFEQKAQRLQEIQARLHI